MNRLGKILMQISFLIGSLNICFAISEDSLVDNTAELRTTLQTSAPAGYLVHGLSSLVKARPDQLPPEPVREIVLHAAQGEAESAQIIVTPLTGMLEQVLVTADLRGPGDAALPVEMHILGTVPIKRATAVSFGKTGDYPDPLKPMKPFNVEPGRSQSIWLTAWVPQGAVAGEYKGVITVQPANAPLVELPISVTVYDFVLPRLSTLKTMVLCYDGIPYYGDKGWPAAMQFMNDELLRNRVSQMWMGNPWNTVFKQDAEGKWTANWEVFDADVQQWLDRGRTTFLIPHDSTFNLPFEILERPEKQSEASQKLVLLNQHLSEKGWADRFFIYAFDEPTPDRAWPISKFCSFVRKYAPHITVLMTDPHGNMLGTGNVHIPHIHRLNNATYIGSMARVIREDEQFWTYTCMGTHWAKNPDNWRIDWYGSSHRALGWLLYQMGCEGYLYWNASYWYTGSGENLTKYDLLSHPSIILQEDYDFNGEGFMFYQDAENEPLPYSTMRLEIMRDAIEDYDLLSLLERRIRDIRSDPDLVLKYGPEKMETAFGAMQTWHLIRAADDFEKDGALYEQSHKALLEALVLLK